ncbi:MAG: PAS domain S-box protein [Flavobacteriales bacterium]|nr:PAS domain S-box protein [Flavobacteriales bacterium]
MSETPKIESRFETIFNHVNEGILIAGSNGQIILSNPKCNHMFGYSENELMQQSVDVLVPDSVRRHHEAHRNKYMSNPVKRPMGGSQILYGRRKDGSQFPVEISLSYYESAEGLYVIAFIIDITERFEQQEKIRRMNQELKTLNEELERKVGERTLVLKEALRELETSRDELSEALDKEKELNEMKTRFISMASHEFRTPLSTILSSVSLIGKYVSEQEQDKREKHINRVKNAVSGLTEILNDFLSIGKLEEGKVSAKWALNHTSEIIDEVMGEMNSLCKPGQTVIVKRNDVCELETDKHIMRNILFNLLSNAIKFSPPESEIWLTSEIEGDCWRITVKDQGIGMSEEDQRHLFERFFRARNAANIQGTGLGLHIVSKYLELLSGQVFVTSELEKGSTFTIEIPIKPAI